MEPLESAKNEESSGFSRRRISSILKAPRKSTIFPNPEQQENVVECPKSVEKRNSRRVSFAPANDVLLFSNDVKKASPTRSPLQDLMTTAAATKYRVQVGLTEDGIEEITGMETLLNAPLHASPHRAKVNFDIGGDFGEKTVMFSTDDAFMDMTQSQTINIANDKEILADILPTSREKTVTFTAGDGSMDVTQSHTANIASGTVSLPTSTSKGLSAEMSSVNPSVPYLIPDFENFIVNLFKPSVPSVNPVTTNMMPPAGASSGETNSSSAHIKTQRADVDKENQAPTSLSAVMEKSINTSRKIGESSSGCALYPKDGESMDMTETQTGRIRGFTDDDTPFQSLYPTEDASSHLDSRVSQTGEKTTQQQGSKTPASFNTKDLISSKNPSLHAPQQRHMVKFSAEDDCSEKTVRFTADDACMDVTRSHTVNIVRDLEIHSHQNVDFLPAYGEKTVRFSANDADMDVTRCHTGNISVGFDPQSHHNVDYLPACGEKTVRFTAEEAGMDMTQSHTVNIASDLKLHSQQNVNFVPACGGKTVRFDAKDAAMDAQAHQKVDFVPACGEKTVRFTAEEAGMNMTQSHTVNIASDLKLHSQQNVNFVPACGEKTVRFDAKDAAMDAQPHQNVDFVPACGEKTVRFTAEEACMDVTQSHSVNIASDPKTDAGHPDRDSNILSSHENMDFLFPLKRRGSETRYPRRNQSSSAHTLDPDSKISLSKTTDPWANPVIAKAAPAAPLETVDTRSGFLDRPKTQEPDVDTANEAPGYVSAVVGNPVNNTMVDCPKDDVRTATTEAQTGHLLGQRHTDEPPLFSSSTQSLYSNSDHLDKTEGTSQQSNVVLETFNIKGAEITDHPGYLDSNEADNGKEPEQRNPTSSPNAGDNVDAVPSRKSRRDTLAHFNSKIRRLSQMIKTAPDTVATEGCTVPLPPLEDDNDKNTKDKTKSLPVMEPEPEMGSENTEENTQAGCLMGGEQPSTASTTPFNLKTVQLISRLSVGAFKAKLPERSKPNNSKKVKSAGEETRTMTVSVTNQQSDFDGDVSDIYDEVLGICEDMSEVLDTRSPQKATDTMSPPLEFDIDEEGLISAVYGKKRSLPRDENHTEEDEKRMKPSTETATDFEMGSQPHLEECDGNSSTPPCVTTQTTDNPNSSQTASTRCEATFESTFKQSLFESQLEDYASDLQRKFDDGSITVLEFFKLFNIDFVIHNPRQSVLPENILSDADLTRMDLLKDRHINHPKQMVYEKDVLALTENVEALKKRKRDLDKPLKIVNKSLWDDMRNSSEKELKSFGAKLKERNNLFRKTSKLLSHEMKEALYSNLVQAGQEEKQRLRGTIEKADEMLKSLDDCIHGIEAELAAVEEKGFEDKPSLKSLQEEMKKVNEALADSDRQITELEMQKNQKIDKTNRLKAETEILQSNIDTLHLLNEWRFGENGDNCTVYTFLHESIHLQLVYEESNGKDVDDQSERKISQITFYTLLDAERSTDHACLVHKLLTQYVQGEVAWVEKYPTSRYVPKLLHDVGLVVGRCRLLGEELRLLKMWGGLRLDILSISCVGTQVHIVFSSLKKFSKFEVILSVSLTNHLCVLQVESFKNVIGSTTIQQIEEIVASFSPGRNTLTKIVKKIHENLLC